MAKTASSRRVTAVALFAALAVFLNASPYAPKIPAPFAPYLIYQVWEIPIVVSLLLFGPKVATLISIINTLVLLAVFPGALPTGPFYNLAALLSMLMGICLFKKMAPRTSEGRREPLLLAALTAFGVVARVAVMTFFNWACLPQSPPIGFGMPMAVVVAALPVIGFFNATLALYTIPLAYFIAKAVRSSTKMWSWYFRGPSASAG
ncbi:MAG: hypothetical protein JTT11_02595 [Candidatus Brockarchaeota archaeon]|nr:hypothetical protein [Candidatus Brockarchaeota archaeon]